ncbi:CD9 antigen-like [Puntigrus tetrazona]|uniref:CD9 antigen-like n=1 Tax=Puntigrus tetrazona TaxID=1606681 RepID=UPI001C896B0D|nr:CD9 antigen-like [Puntigrus tetrazona]
MAVEGGAKCIKYLLFFFNFIFWVCGLALIVLGVLAKVSINTTAFLNGYAGAPLVLIVVGVIIFFIAFFGCCGAWKENQCMITMVGIKMCIVCAVVSCAGVYILIAAGGLVMLVGFFGCCGAVRESQCLLGLFFACLLVIFGAEVAAGVFGFLNKDEIIKEIKQFYDESARNNSSNTTVKSYHSILNCCGSSSVCLDAASNQTCHEAIEEFFNSKLFIVGYVGIGIAGVMIIGMIFSMVLCCAIRNSREVI